MDTPPLKELSPEEIELGILHGRLMTAMGTGVDLDSRTIYLIGDIDVPALQRFAIALSVLDSTEGPIRLILSSGGGSEPDGYAIYDLIKRAKNNVIIEGYGSVQSIAALIFQASGYRFLARECRFMIHNGGIELGHGVNSDTLIAIGKEVERNNRRYHQILSDRSGLDIDKVRAMSAEETYLSPSEAVEAGFADGLVGSAAHQSALKPTKRKKRR